MYKVIISLTTSPSRLNHLVPVIHSFINQDYPIEHIELNLPDLYKNREEYVIPEKLTKIPKLKIFRTGKDLGPATKIVPTIMRHLGENVYIVSLDDDHKYPPKIVSTLLKGLVLYGPCNIYTIGGINVHIGSKDTIIGVNHYRTDYVDVLEGVFGVLYNPMLFDEELLVYIHKVIECKECLTSDDITLSNYLAYKDIKIMRLNFKSFNKLILYKNILFKNLTVKISEKDKNAIHLMPGGHKRRYFDACKWLGENEMLYLKVREPYRY